MFSPKLFIQTRTTTVRRSARLRTTGNPTGEDHIPIGKREQDIEGLSGTSECDTNVNLDITISPATQSESDSDVDSITNTADLESTSSEELDLDKSGNYDFSIDDNRSEVSELPSDSDDVIVDSNPRGLSTTTDTPPIVNHAVNATAYKLRTRTQTNPIRKMNEQLELVSMIAHNFNKVKLERYKQLVDRFTLLACLSTDATQSASRPIRQKPQPRQDGRDTINGLLIEPTYQEAMSGVDRDKWIEAMEIEINQMRKLKVWEQTPKADLPTGKVPIGCRWVFLIKTKANGPNGDRVIDRYRARLVAQGFSQRYGSDYQETYSPVMKMSTLRFITATAARLKCNVKMFDIAVAYLNADLDEDIYMRIPPGFGNQHQSVLKLNKAIYGLKQSGRLWFQLLSEFLRSLKFKQSDTDKCLFYKHVNGHLIMIGVYVDDLVVVGRGDDIYQLQRALEKRFEVRELGDISQCLGIQFHQLKDGSRFIYQQKYIKEVLTRFDQHLNGKYPITIPMPTDHKHLIKPRQVDEDELDSKEFPYRELIGCLMYMVVATRPDIAFATSLLARFVINPAKRHWDAAINVLRYLQGTDHYGILYQSGQNADIITFTDAGDSSDSIEEKGQTGVVLTLSKGAIIFYSNKQTLSSLHIHDAEQVAMVEGIKDALYMSYIQKELGLSNQGPMPIWTDSAVVVQRIIGDHHTHENRYVNKRYNWGRYQHTTQSVEIAHIEGKENPADLFTKPLSRDLFHKHCESIGIRCIIMKQGHPQVVSLDHEWARSFKREKRVINAETREMNKVVKI